MEAKKKRERGGETMELSISVVSEERYWYEDEGKRKREKYKNWLEKVEIGNQCVFNRENYDSDDDDDMWAEKRKEKRSSKGERWERCKGIKVWNGSEKFYNSFEVAIKWVFDVILTREDGT